MVLSLKENPFPLILNQGSPASILQVLKVSLQNYDGGFRRDFEFGNPSSVKITYRVIRTLTYIGIGRRSHIVMSAISWLVNQQEKDGGWHENPAITLPQRITWESTTKGVTWYTCQIAMLLHELLMHKTSAFRKALSFLEKTELPSGGWPSVVGLRELDADSTVGIGNFLAKLYGANHPSVLRAKRIFEERMSELAERFLHKTIDDAYQLTHLIFDEVPNYMCGLDDERARRVLEMLVRVQRKDGGWRTFYSCGKSDVAITVYVLRVLVSHGLLERETLQEMFDRAAKGC